LRTREKIKSFAIDLSPIPNEFKQLEYYRQENGTATRFADSSVRGVSLQCAFEMFSGNDDVALIGELSRILKKGGKAIILPLYMHTSYCFYATPDFYGRNDQIQESDADVYIRFDCEGIPSSRKYSAAKLNTRIISEIKRNSMDYTLRVLRNKSELGPDNYCHFILEITK
jgi:ubiquinone/menaquinone biosynthesis C-methylase UbiE